MKLLPQNEFEYYLTYEGNRAKLIFAPVGWDSDTIGNLARDEYYDGLLRTLSLPLNFALDGWEILTEAFIKYGYEAEVILEVLQLNRTNFTYDPLFSSELDFSQYDNDGTTVSIIMMEGGVSKLIKAKESVKYEYPLVGADVVNMIIPGVVFTEDAQSIFTPIGGSDRYMPAIDLVVNNTKSEFVTVKNVEQQENISDETIFSSSDNWFVRGNRDSGQLITVSGVIRGVAGKSIGSGNDFKIVIRDNNNVNVAQIYQSPSIPSNSSIQFDAPFSFDLTIAKDQRYFIYVRTDTFPAILRVTIAEGDLNINYSSKSDPSNCKGIKAIDLFKRIIKRISPQTAANSYLIPNQWDNLIITCGNAIREQQNASIQTTFRDFFDTMNGLQSAGFGLENEIAVLEKRSYFFRKVQIADLGEAKKCNLTVATDRIFNSLTIGYKDGNTEDTDGQFEYNSTQEYAMPVSRIQRKEDWTSPYRADQYGIERLRVGFVKKTNDTSSDNDVFMFDCYYDGNYRPILGASGYTAISGMPNNNAGLESYNLRLTPKQNLLRHDEYLRSMLDKMDSRYIEFASAEKNKDLVTIDNAGRRVAEKDSVAIASLGGKYFKPIIANITIKLPRNIMRLMDLTPFGFMTFSFEGKTYKGYILDFGVDLAYNKEREVKLLLTDDNYA